MIPRFGKMQLTHPDLLTLLPVIQDHPDFVTPEQRRDLLTYALEDAFDPEKVASIRSRESLTGAPRGVALRIVQILGHENASPSGKEPLGLFVTYILQRLKMRLEGPAVLSKTDQQLFPSYIQKLEALQRKDPRLNTQG
jgi:hypothetical protein